ncbi:hypothetical protein [Marivirga sp.]|uniref:hypothetical protein n=1 Tax=Marivirga sp. TaxID=2018662 RepID=UPI002D806FAA|nr:hypothetical protein [Marivirga sp.]HET8859067.1 hypothetical protein [Marivirga sp.]
MKKEVVHYLENFLNDFQYFKIDGYDAFHHQFSGGSKIIVINSTPYEDGLMLEIQLAIRIDKIEELVFGFYNQEKDKLSLSYWESLSQISSEIPKRNFIQNEIELLKVISEVENALVKKGFNWLDDLADLNKWTDYFNNVIFNSIKKPSNIFKICQRSYVLRIIKEEKITDSVFYDYYEQLQNCKVQNINWKNLLILKIIFERQLFK